MFNLTERHFNTFDASVDVFNVKALGTQKQFMRAIQNVVEGLAVSGEVLKKTSYDASKGVYTTNFAYQGGKDVQSAVTAAVRDVTNKWLEKTGIFKDIEKHKSDHKAGKISDEELKFLVDKAKEEIPYEEIPYRVTNRAADRGTRSSKRVKYTELSMEALDASTVAALRREIMEAGGSARYDSKTHRFDAIIPGASKGGSGKVSASDVVERIDKSNNVREKKTQEMLALKSPDTKAFRNAAMGRLDKTAAREKANMIWAKKNIRSLDSFKRKLAKSIIQRNREKSAGGKLLSRVSAGAARLVKSFAITAILTAVSAAVKFLSALPNVARDVFTLASNSVKFNVQPEVLKKYEHMGSILDPQHGKEWFNTFLANIHIKLGEVVGGDVKGAIGESFAALSSRVGGGHINVASTRYAVPGVYNDADVMHSALNDVALATFQLITSTGTAASEKAAQSSNRNTLAGSYGEYAASLSDALFALWETWATGSPEEFVRANRVRANVLRGGVGNDFLTQMMLEGGGNVSSIIVASSLVSDKDRDISTKFAQFKGDWEATGEGILQTILSRLDSVLDTLNEILDFGLGLAATLGVQGAREFLNERREHRGARNLTEFEHLQENVQIAEGAYTRLTATWQDFDRAGAAKDAYDLAIAGGNIMVHDFATREDRQLTDRELEEFIVAYADREYLQQAVADYNSNRKYATGERTFSGVSATDRGLHAQAQINKHREKYLMLASYLLENVTDKDSLYDVAASLATAIGREQDVLNHARLRSVYQYFAPHVVPALGGRDTSIGRGFLNYVNSEQALRAAYSILFDLERVLDESPEVAEMNYASRNAVLSTGYLPGTNGEVVNDAVFNRSLVDHIQVSVGQDLLDRAAQETVRYEVYFSSDRNLFTVEFYDSERRNMVADPLSFGTTINMREVSPGFVGTGDLNALLTSYEGL